MTIIDRGIQLKSVFQLANGARPDLRDTHHRTSVHHALRHPRLLWLCESSLRKQRIREYTVSSLVSSEWRHHVGLPFIHAERKPPTTTSTSTTTRRICTVAHWVFVRPVALARAPGSHSLTLDSSTDPCGGRQRRLHNLSASFSPFPPDNCPCQPH